MVDTTKKYESQVFYGLQSQQSCFCVKPLKIQGVSIDLCVGLGQNSSSDKLTAGWVNNEERPNVDWDDDSFDGVGFVSVLQ
jgi:hypothetical protein